MEALYFLLFGRVMRDGMRATQKRLECISFIKMLEGVIYRVV